MNTIYRLVWNRARGLWVVASELAKRLGTHTPASDRRNARNATGRAGLALRRPERVARCVLAGAALLGAFDAYGQACTTTGGTISAPTSATCNINTAGSTLTITGSGALTGWANFNAANTSFVVDAGGTFNFGTALGGNGTNAIGVGVTADATGWSLTNNGTLSLLGNGGVDLIALRRAGSYTIVNAGTMQADQTSNTIEASAQDVILNLTNTGTLTSANGATFNVTNGTALIVTNSGLISSSQHRAFDVLGDVTITNQAGGIIRTLDAADFAISSTGRTTVINAGTISTAGGAGQAAISLGSANDTVILEPTSIITGFVNASGGTDTLDLSGAAGSGSFNLASLGLIQQYRDFQTFEKVGGSSWTLTGSNTNQTGISWNLMAGELILASGASLNGSVVNPSTATAPVTLQVNGAISSGTGVAINMAGPFTNSVVLNAGAAFGVRTFQHSAGTTVLTGAVAFPNAVTISGGTLQVGDGGAGTGGSITGPITDNASLVFNRSDSLTHSGVISGTGSVTQAGAGTTVLTTQAPTRAAPSSMRERCRSAFPAWTTAPLPRV